MELLLLKELQLGEPPQHLPSHFFTFSFASVVVIFLLVSDFGDIIDWYIARTLTLLLL